MNTQAEKISDTEAEIMKVIWSKDTPVTYAEIRKAINRTFDWGSQVINTMVKRLVQKGVLRQEKKEVYYYSALVTEDQYTEEKTKSFVQKVYQGDVKGLLLALMKYDNITQEDYEELKRYWERGVKPNE
ncbi:MAG: BlaI/MecI/CopY family transcriptional regulator [Clostridiales bacterium]|nr:BlaI/MecI/CopY family transcriptional regulator [Clostridiales bacterium]